MFEELEGVSRFGLLYEIRIYCLVIGKVVESIIELLRFFEEFLCWFIEGGLRGFWI